MATQLQGIAAQLPCYSSTILVCHHVDQTAVQIELQLYWRENSLNCGTFMVSNYN